MTVRDRRKDEHSPHPCIGIPPFFHFPQKTEMDEVDEDRRRAGTLRVNLFSIVTISWSMVVTAVGVLLAMFTTLVG